MSAQHTVLRLGYRTDVGKVRDHQEDALTWYDPADDEEALRRKGRLYVVADGMGGHAAGEVASRLAVETIAREYQADASTDVTAVLRRAIEAANAVIYQEAQTGSNVGMGTTVVCAVLRGDELYVAHVGDSRAYLLQGGSLRQLTEDHTLVNEQVRRHEISVAEAAESPNRHILSRALGKQPAVVPDVQGPIQLKAGDLVLLCTDGICGYLSDEQIEFDLKTHPDDPQAAADALVYSAEQTGGEDNATAIVVRVERPVRVTRVAKATRPAPAAASPARSRTPQGNGIGLLIGFLLLAFGATVGFAAGSLLSGTAGLPFWLDLRARGEEPTPRALLSTAGALLRGTPLPTAAPSQVAPSAIGVTTPRATPTQTALPTSMSSAVPTYTATSQPPSPSPSATATPTATITPTPTPSVTPTLTASPQPTATPSAAGKTATGENTYGLSVDFRASGVTLPDVRPVATVIGLEQPASITVTVRTNVAVDVTQLSSYTLESKSPGDEISFRVLLRASTSITLTNPITLEVTLDAGGAAAVATLGQTVAANTRLTPRSWFGFEFAMKPQQPTQEKVRVAVVVKWEDNPSSQDRLEALFVRLPNP